MKKQIISFMLATAISAALLPVLPAGAEGNMMPASVSGYVSTESGSVTLVNEDMTPVIHIDNGDYEGVIRAANNLAGDIEKVTGKEVSVECSDTDVNLFSDNEGKKVEISSIDQKNGTMTIAGYVMLTKKGRGIVAVYNSNKIEAIYLSSDLAGNENGTLHFADLPDFGGKKVKGFLWEDNNGLTVNPLTEIFNYTQTTEPTVTPTAEPTATPTAEPTATPTVAPTASPTVAPTATPTAEPTATPTVEPTATPTVSPTVAPTASPTVEPTATPVVSPTVAPTATPTAEPTATPTVEPTATPTVSPTVAPTATPTAEPTVSPTVAPTATPIASPTIEPTSTPTATPTTEPGTEYVDIIVGTIGKSDEIDALVESGDLKVDDIEGEWEAFTIQEVDGAIVIAGSDKRGTIYGIYDLSEKIGVSPWYYWADVKPGHADELYIDLPEGGYTEGESSVKYRGIFLNDEHNFNQWAKNVTGKNMTHETYEKVFELILRLKANTLWPAMHKYSADFHEDPDNARLADEYGIVIGSSHCEPMLRNNLGELYEYQKEWESEHPDKKLYNYLKDEEGHPVAWMWTDHNDSNETVYNKEFIKDYWRDSVKGFGEYENIYTLGMRGVHDEPFKTNMDGLRALQEIIDTQYQILEDELCADGTKIEDIPKVFIPYKDVLPYYESLDIPEDVTIMWTDDNFGYVRQFADETERTNSGKSGVYYHISYYGSPSSYLWISSTQPGLIREELVKAYDTGADKMWILNVGDLKPAEKEIEYYAKLARNIDDMRDADISETYEEMAKRDFGFEETDAVEYAAIMDEYYELANSNRPEFIRSGNFSLTAYGDEAERYLERYKDICERAEELNKKLPADKKDAFYELVLYPIRGAKNMAVDYVQTDRANLYAEQGRGQAANALADEAKAAVKAIDDEVEYYNNTLANGKWNGMAEINPEHFSQYKDCEMPLHYNELTAQTVDTLDYAQLAVMTDSDDLSITVSAYDSYDKYFDVVNQGYGSFDYTVAADNEAITLDKTEGTVYGSDRVHIGVDKTKLTATGTTAAKVTVSQMLNDNVVDTKDIAVTISNPDVTLGDKTYVETNGTVSVEAEHYSKLVENGVYHWEVEKDFGRSGDSLKIYPNLVDAVDNDASTATTAGITEKSAYAEYDIYFTTSGSYTVNVYRMPTLNTNGKCRVAVGLDDGTPTVLSGTNAVSGTTTRVSGTAWVKQVLANTEVLTAKNMFTISESGTHKLRLYNVSPGMVIDKIVLTKNTEPYSYFGAPESYNTTYNTERLASKKPTDTSAEGAITKVFEPKAVAGIVERAGGKIAVPLYRLDDNLTEAIVAVTGYDNNGFMTACDFEKVTFTGDAASATLDLDDGIANYAVTVFDNFTNLQPIAPYKEFGNIVTTSDSSNNSISVSKSLNDYAGKHSIVLVADTDIDETITADDIKYFRGETLTKTSYKNIPFTMAQNSAYSIRVGIDGENPIDDKISITPDTDGEKLMLFNENFENYTIDTSKWNGTADSVLSVEEKDGNKYLQYKSSGNTVGAWTSVDSGKRSSNTVVVKADLNLTWPGNSAGNSQFTIGSDTPKFDGNDIGYGIVSSSGTRADGHILAFEYNSGNKLIVNGEEISTNFIGGWMHITAEVNFDTQKINLALTSDKPNAEPVEFADMPFFSGNTITDVGSIYVRAAKPSGTVCVDNLEIYEKGEPQYAIAVTPVDASSGDTIDDATIMVTSTSGAAISAETGGEFSGKYLLKAGTYTITVKADGYADAQQTFEVSPSTTSKEVKVLMFAPSTANTATIKIGYFTEEGPAVKEIEIENVKYYSLSDGTTYPETYTVPEEYTKDFVLKQTDGSGRLYEYRPSTITKPFSEVVNGELTFRIDVRNTEEYNYYEDFEDVTGTSDTDKWHLGSGTSVEIKSDNTKYLKQSTPGSSSTGAYMTFNKVDAENRKIKITADVKFDTTSGSGLGQFAISSNDPKFGSDNTNNGISTGSTHHDGHIFALMYRPGKKLYVNGESVSINMDAGEWIHIEATADFANKTVDMNLTSDSGGHWEGTESFFSGNVSNIGSIYMRSPGYGALSVDNVIIKDMGPAKLEAKVSSPINYAKVYAFGDSIVEGHNDKDHSFMRLIQNDYAIDLNMLAKNGATIIKDATGKESHIFEQVQNAPDEAPDFVVFDGYTNDAYGAGVSGKPDVTKIYGDPEKDDDIDESTFCGSFRKTIKAMRDKWGNDVKIVFVTIHKSNARDEEIQLKLRELTMQMCDRLNVEIADVFSQTNVDGKTLDTTGHSNKDEYMNKYIIDGSGSHPTVTACKEFYIPAVVTAMEKLAEE